MTAYRLQPEISRQGGDLVVGDAGLREKDQLLLGTLAESGARRRLWLDISGEQVVAIFGKRGTGKSYSLGVLLEGLSAGHGASPLAKLETPRGALVFDIMDIFWSSQIALSDQGPAEIRKQYQLMRRANAAAHSVNVDVWVPGGFENPDIDPPQVKTLYISPDDLSVEDWGALFEVDVYAEPRGMLIADVVQSLLTDGYTNKDTGNRVRAVGSFNFAALLKCLDESAEVAANYQSTTIRSVRQRMSSLAALPLFSGTPTSLTDLIQPFRSAVLMLARAPDPLKNVIVATLLRRIMRERRDASFAQKRLDLTPDLSEPDKQKLEQVIAACIPRTWVLMDEAHILAGAGPNALARESFVKFAKEGRNYGLSLALATQQPSALDTRLTSQVETLISHQLTSPKDAAVARDSIRSPLPGEINIDGAQATTEGLLRRLDQGSAVFSSANAPKLPRFCIVSIRPRVTAHGGYEA